MSFHEITGYACCGMTSSMHADVTCGIDRTKITIVANIWHCGGVSLTLGLHLIFAEMLRNKVVPMRKRTHRMGALRGPTGYYIAGKLGGENRNGQKSTRLKQLDVKLTNLRVGGARGGVGRNVNSRKV